LGNYILIAEDDLDDQMLLQEAFEQCNCPVPVYYFTNGIAVQEFLASANEPPAFAMLDLNMPKLNGLGTLKWMRNEYDHPKVPVLILTTSTNKIEEHKCRVAGANGFYLKPNSFEELVTTVCSVLALYDPVARN